MIANNPVRVCVIGAGPSGTAVLRAFASAQKKGTSIPEVVCFEKQPQWGGLWNYSWRIGLDASGQPVHNSMYRNLWSNGPKECLEFADYTFEEHFKFPIPSFPPREVLFDYITGRVEKSGVKKWVRVNSAVKATVFNAETQKFAVTVRNTKTDAETTEFFDYVLCCTGHFSTPNVPEFPGMDAFQGRIMHAHDFRSAEQFEGKRVLVIGTSYSAEDIASQCYKYGAKSVHCSWRTAPMGFHWPANFTTVPLLTKIDPGTKTCHFKDGSTADIDAIILCTGYQHSFPFVEPALRLKTANRLWCDSLHEGVVWPPNPCMMYIGMQDQWFTFNMFDAQAWYARDIILGRITLPDAGTMAKEWAKHRAAEEAIAATDEANIRYQADYVKRLQALTDYPTFDIEGVVQAFLEWEHNKHENVMTFRDQPHRSVMTGTMAPVHQTPWLTAFDDSMESYVDGNKPGARAKSAVKSKAAQQQKLQQLPAAAASESASSATQPPIISSAFPSSFVVPRFEGAAIHHLDKVKEYVTPEEAVRNQKIADANPTSRKLSKKLRQRDKDRKTKKVRNPLFTSASVCLVCRYHHGIRRETTHYCRECDVAKFKHWPATNRATGFAKGFHPRLCSMECFKLFHTTQIKGLDYRVKRKRYQSQKKVSRACKRIEI